VSGVAAAVLAGVLLVGRGHVAPATAP
jgi:hypothetical protein